MDDNDYLFNKMVGEAVEEVANKGWKDADQNAVTLAAFGMLSKLVSNRMHSFTKPLWWAAGAIGVAALTYIVGAVLGAH